MFSLQNINNYFFGTESMQEKQPEKSRFGADFTKQLDIFSAVPGVAATVATMRVTYGIAQYAKALFNGTHGFISLASTDDHERMIDGLAMIAESDNTISEGNEAMKKGIYTWILDRGIGIGLAEISGNPLHVLISLAPLQLVPLIPDYVAGRGIFAPEPEGQKAANS